MTVKRFVQERLKEGLSPEEVWRETQIVFPFKCVGWGYVQHIKREMGREESLK